MEILTELINRIFDPANFDLGNFDINRLPDLYASILDSSIFWNVRTFALLISLIMLVAIIYLYIKLGKFKALANGLVQEVKVPTIKNDDGPTRARWEEILRHADSNKESEWKFAIIEADKLMDDILRKAGFIGTTMGERLMTIQKDQLQSLDLIWEAHKIRNRLAHDLNYFLRHAEAKKAIQLYGRALEELGAI